MRGGCALPRGQRNSVDKPDGQKEKRGIPTAVEAIPAKTMNPVQNEYKQRRKGQGVFFDAGV